MASPNLDSERLQIIVPNEVKAKLQFAALLSRPQTTMGALSAFLIEEAVERYIGGLDDLTQQRVKLRLRSWRDGKEEDDDA